MSKKLKKVDDIEETVDNIEDKTPSREEIEAILDERPEDTRKAKKKNKKKQDEDEKPQEVNIVKELLNLILYIGIVVILCYLINHFVGCRSRVDGNSMNPTLEDGDNLWVSKIAYRIGDPKRFDVVIFDYDEDTTYVKRIIGLPGETVRIDQAGNIYINEELLEENYGIEPILPTNLGRANQPILLGEDEYFVLGDNRNHSQDSRWSDVGNVSRDDIIGKVIFRIYPFNKIGRVK